VWFGVRRGLGRGPCPSTNIKKLAFKITDFGEI